jgi:hypothetical protein
MTAVPIHSNHGFPSFGLTWLRKHRERARQRTEALARERDATGDRLRTQIQLEQDEIDREFQRYIAEEREVPPRLRAAYAHNEGARIASYSY